MHDQLAAIWMMLSFPMKKKSSEELDFSSSFIKNFILTLDQCCLIDWLIDWSSWVFVGFLNILKKHDRITGSQIRRKFCMQRLNHTDFVLYASAVNAEYCLSLLKRIPNPHMRSSTRGWSLPRLQTTHVQSEQSTGSSSSAAAHPSPLMSTRGRNVSLHLRQQRLQLLSSSDGDFNYITAANAAKAANRMVCNTVSSTCNSDSVVVLYRGAPI